MLWVFIAIVSGSPYTPFVIFASLCASLFASSPPPPYFSFYRYTHVLLFNLLSRPLFSYCLSNHSLFWRYFHRSKIQGSNNSSKTFALELPFFLSLPPSYFRISVEFLRLTEILGCKFTCLREFGSRGCCSIHPSPECKNGAHTQVKTRSFLAFYARTSKKLLLVEGAPLFYRARVYTIGESVDGTGGISC